MTGQTYECENFVVVLWGYNTASKNLTAMCVHKRNGVRMKTCLYQPIFINP